MKLPAACPFAMMAESQLADDGPDLSDCCRAGALDWFGEEPLCRSQTEHEAYRFYWRSSFNGDAVVHIGHSGASIALRWTYLSFRDPGGLEMPATMALTPGAWEKLQLALEAAKFWVLGPAGEEAGLDGAQWLIEGRRGQTYHAVHRWSPRGAVYDLGHLFFDLAGPPLALTDLY